MIKDNEIIFANPNIELFIKRNMESIVLSQKDPEKAAQIIRGKSIQELGEEIIGGYLDTLLNKAMMRNLTAEQWIDLTYDTIDKLPYALIALYKFQAAIGYSPEENAVIIGKTIAAVMYGLAMNEHGYTISVKGGTKQPLWADRLRIYINGIKKADFLEPGLRAVLSSPFVMQSGVFVDMNPVITAYQAVTGKNLAEYGIANIMLSGV